MVGAMKRYAGVAVMFGIAAGALAYRYGMLPLDWASRWRFVLPGAAIGLAVGAHQILRSARDDRDAKRAPFPLLLGLGVIGALIAFGLAWLAFPTLERARLATRQFPGFSLAMPSGTVVEDIGDYTAGKLTLKDVANSRSVIAIEWSAGTAMSDEDLGMISRALSGVLQSAKGFSTSPSITTLPGAGGKPVKTAVLDGADSQKFLMSVLTCGVRNVMFGTMASDADIVKLHQRIIASFTCTPDPAQEKAATIQFPLVLDLPGWYSDYQDPDQIGITDGESGHLTLRTMPIAMNVELEKVIKPMFEAAGAQHVEVGTPRDGRIPMKLTFDGETAPGWAKLIKCPTVDALVLALANDDATADLLYERVSKARCIAKGEPPQQWPPAPPAAPPAVPEPPAQ